MRNNDLVINLSKSNADKIKEFSSKNQTTLSRYLNAQLEEYADVNGIHTTDAEVIDHIIRVANLSDKAKSAFMHLQNEMLDKILK